jgi:hypothetical protein
MNKAQKRDVSSARLAVQMGMSDMAARQLSASIRAALRDRDAREMHDIAIELGITGEADYIVQALS